MKIITINSKLEICKGIADFTEDDIKNEPMLFNCDKASAYDNAGPITHEALDALPWDWRISDLTIDSRVHMLMPGWFPCIPGWHHDDVPRTRSDGQPNYEDCDIRSEHMMLLVNGNICPTQFALGEADFVVPEKGKIIYREWHKDVESAIDNKDISRYDVPSNRWLKFDDRTWHQGTAAVANGWRYFIRVTRHKDRYGNTVKKPTKNEIRRQCQVYMPAPFAGW